MKKWISMLLALCLLGTTALADVLDLSYVREKNSIFNIDVDNESDVAFIKSTTSAKERSFVHKYESDTRYSSTRFDVLVVDYSKTTAYPVPRLWITYAADEFLYINSVSFYVDGKKFTFSGISNKDWQNKFDNGIVEECLIKFGSEQIDFLVAMEHELKKYPTYDELMDPEKGPKIRMVLHGKEDVEVTLGSYYVMDFAFVIEGAYLNMNGMDYIEKVYGTTMKETDIK